MVTYLNMIEIFQIFAQKTPKKWTFGQKSGGLFKFSLNFPVVANNQEWHHICTDTVGKRLDPCSIYVTTNSTTIH